ncbi:glutamine amidotransferase [Luteimonas yindakuii]|uniref:Glutamine amidotransferase n=1 Tax=Luteimonas yindakuii TaxID=2565782 RepID=A0A4Z1RK51_9GAMM|nr:glutamine amidotransferase [Luteimonas yindakuii]TKS55107.1 glutamine amidotransferase [Luteimonas yindakuii]
MTASFLILETGRPIASMRRHGGFDHWIRVAAGLRASAVETVDAQTGATLPDPGDRIGVLVTGSGAMVSDREPWSERAAPWLKAAVESGVPVFGICYGHQLLAHALGGEVADNPAGRGMGTVQVETTAGAADDPLFAALPSPFAAQATHLQSVRHLPEGAQCLATAQHDPNYAFRFGDQAWGVQFHPEFSAMHMRGYIRARADALRAEGTDPVALARAVSAAPHARNLLRRFVRHAYTVRSRVGAVPDGR